MTIDFNALSIAANSPGGMMDDNNRLFTAVFALPNWYFIARGSLPDVQPYIAGNAGIVEGKAMLKAFTDTDRLYTFAKDNGLLDANGAASILSIPVEGVLPMLAGHAQGGVWGIHFNADLASDGFYAPLVQMPIIHAHLRKHGFI